MKNVSILFLSIVLLFGMLRATVIFHYCGGKLHSVALVYPEKRACCHDGEGKRSSAEDGVSFRKVPCCFSLYQVTGTDDFSTTSSTALSCGDEKEFQLPAFFFGRPMAPVIQAFQSFFPPGGVVSSGMDRLVRIGILRI